MLATRDEALKKVSEHVKLAGGDSYLVYRAYNELENPTSEKIQKFIEDNKPKVA